MVLTDVTEPLYALWVSAVIWALTPVFRLYEVADEWSLHDWAGAVVDDEAD
jgi:hypothetical protein